MWYWLLTVIEIVLHVSSAIAHDLQMQIPTIVYLQMHAWQTACCKLMLKCQRRCSDPWLDGVQTCWPLTSRREMSGVTLWKEVKLNWRTWQLNHGLPLYTALNSFLNSHYSIKSISSYMNFVPRKRAVIRIRFRAEQINQRSRVVTASSNTQMN